jgi:hypothetical protein
MRLLFEGDSITNNLKICDEFIEGYPSKITCIKGEEAVVLNLNQKPRDSPLFTHMAMLPLPIADLESNIIKPFFTSCTKSLASLFAEYPETRDATL